MKKTIQNKILSMAKKVGPDKTICPSEVARALSDESWRDLMDDVRAEAITLRNEGQIAITQKGRPVSGNQFKGPIRLKIL